ncbi:RecQ-mediated genome instability protein 1 [Golovinomyces cichoracearum]|uniref:RecQ-mediated genome instability protein 1 n=1 Tax=Golovinomyces cichoracearum TaxID=62708 RepID=A0A420IE21_9PEZI|nr:RecQ-mediated genome instability protein 1 [Golovinomyces cichoracearum]
MAATPTLAQVSAFLASQALPAINSTFLTSILTGSTRPQLLQAVAATVKHRLLSSDISDHTSTTPILSPTCSSLPPDINNKNVMSSVLSLDIFVQVLDVQDISQSKLDQLESLEAERKGETRKGREIIRVVPTVDQEPSTAATQCLSTQKSMSKQSKGPFRLILQDCKGTKTWALELKKVDKIGLPPIMNIGCKMWLKKGCKVARGTLLLEPATVTILGGKVDHIDKAWIAGREKVLRATLYPSKETP